VRLAALRGRVAAAGRRLAGSGLVIGTAGNVSARDGDLVAISPTGAELAGLTAEQVAVVDLAGQQVDGAYLPSTEVALHLAAYAATPAAGVAHTHATTAVALSCLLEELPCLHYQLLDLGGPVRVAPYRVFGSRELAEAAGRALAGRSAALLAHHGTLTVGADPEQAARRAELLEWGCEVYWRAAAIGRPRALTGAQQEEVLGTFARRRYGGLQRASGPPAANRPDG
jgi:L-fuculose-phosphate aldolase